jgi:membrane associated rhomboid family serine protease
VPTGARLLFAYLIGLNVFGLVLALTFVVGGLFHMANPVAIAGLIVGIILAVLAGWRTERALRRLLL